MSSFLQLPARLPDLLREFLEFPHFGAMRVERQPFRSMGFVSVIIASVLFALGLPLVLL